MADHKTIEEEVVALGDLTLSALRERWRELYGSAPPKSLRKAFLVKACAYKIQEKAYGGLSGRTRRRLRRLADDISAGKPVSIAPPRRIKPGTRLVRAWDGTVHTVTVIAGGFEYAGARYGSLSAGEVGPGYSATRGRYAALRVASPGARLPAAEAGRGDPRWRAAG